MTDIVCRLRELDRTGYQDVTGAIGEEAATEIQRLRSVLGWIVIRRTDGSVRLNDDPQALEIASKLLAAAPKPGEKP